MQKLNANQKAILGGVASGLVVLLIVGGIYSWSLRAATVDSKLSPRSQEFLKEHKGTVGETAVDFGDGKPFEMDMAIDGSCFSVVVPFASKKASGDEPPGSCTVRLLTQNPTSRLTLSARPFTSPLSEDPAIQLRRQASFGYTESSISAKKYSGIVRFDDKETVSVFWLSAGKMITAAFTGLSDTSKIDDERLVRLIDSIVLNSTPKKSVNKNATSSATTTTSAGL